MQSIAWSVLASTMLFTAGAIGEEQRDEVARDDLRSFAQEHLKSPYVKITEPNSVVQKDGILRFSFGTVSADAEPAILLQLHVELLRNNSFFGKRQTSLMLSELEQIVTRCLDVQDQLDEEFANRLKPDEPTQKEVVYEDQLRALKVEFDQVLKKNLMDYAEDMGLGLAIGDAFSDGDYLYINKERRERQKVSYAELVKTVAAQFDQDRVEFIRPYAVIERIHDPVTGKRKDVIRYNAGTVRGLEQSHLAVADLFRLELLRRYSYVDEELFNEHIKRIDAGIKDEYEKQRKLSLRAAESRWQNTLSQLLWPLEKAGAKSEGCELSVIAAYAPLVDSLSRDVKFELADDVERVVYASGLDFLYARKKMADVPPSRLKAAKNGDSHSIRFGIYNYQLLLKGGRAQPANVGFEIPSQVSPDGKLHLR